MSYSYRANGLNVIEVKELNTIDTYLHAEIVAIGILSALNNKRNKKHLEKLKRFCAAMAAFRLSKTTFYAPKLRGPDRLKRTIMSFTSGECWRRFRFRKRDIPRLLRVLDLDDFEVA